MSFDFTYTLFPSLSRCLEEITMDEALGPVHPISEEITGPEVVEEVAVADVVEDGAEEDLTILQTKEIS